MLDGRSLTIRKINICLTDKRILSKPNGVRMTSKDMVWKINKLFIKKASHNCLVTFFEEYQNKHCCFHGFSHKTGQMKGKSSVAHNGSCSVGKIERHGLYSMNERKKEQQRCKLPYFRYQKPPSNRSLSKIQFLLSKFWAKISSK